jgi:osmoprotectant transport system permease protein
VRLALVALVLGAAASVPGGLWLARRRRLEAGVLGAASVLQTVPSLALLAFMVPLLGALGAFTAAAFGFELPAIGTLPALLALTLYGLLPMLRNTAAGIASVDPALVEAARGVGMTEAQVLRRVQLPLALPVIVAGVRTAAVWIVGTATLSTPVGATSLGNFIFSGLQTRNTAAVLVGCLAAAALALVLDGAIRALERGVRTRRRAWSAGGALALAALALAGAADGLARVGGAPAVAVGAKSFTEQYVLAELLALRVRRATGAATRVVSSLGSTVAFDALRRDEIDAYVDYSGTIWATIMRRGGPPPGRGEVLRRVAEYLAREHGVELACALGFENAYALGMRADRAAALGIARIGELAARAPELEIGGDYEFFARSEWRALVDRYGLAFRGQRSMDPALLYQAVAAGEVDVISAFSSDGRIAANGLVLLEDEGGVIPPYDAVVLVSPRLARERPEVVDALRGLSATIDEASMQRMNLAVDRDGRAPAAVAQEFLDALDAGTARAPR